MKITIDLTTCTRDDLRALLTLTPAQDALRDVITQAAIDDRLDELGDTILRVSRNLKEVPPGKHDLVTPDRAEHVADVFHAATERGLSPWPWLARLATEIKGEFDHLNEHEFHKVAACRTLQNLSTDWSCQDWAAAAEYFGEPASQLRAYGRRRLGLSYCVRMVKAMFPQFDK